MYQSSPHQYKSILASGIYTINIKAVLIAKDSFSLGSNENSSRLRPGGFSTFIATLQSLSDFDDYCVVKKLELKNVLQEELADVAKEILAFTDDRKIFAFNAEMGAGKTTLIKALCTQLGSHDNFSSPSYSIVNEYMVSSSERSKIYHIDLYRLKDTQEALAIGIEEYLNSGNYCFIEWPELIEPYLPDDRVKIIIEGNENVRNVSIFIE
jgi:tRNA threonylcarbamoyladenosine biosynthesis protein TsaE